MSKAPLGNLYNLRLLAPNHYAIGKFTADLNFEAQYELTPKGHSYTCTCPAGQRTVKLKPCKHARMMPLMLGAVNTNRFYNPDSGTWCEPLALEDAVIDNGDLSGVAVALESIDPTPPPAPTPPPTSRPVVTRRI